MITVADILALPAFHTVEAINADADAYTRRVDNVGIVDATPDEDAYSDYLPHEFIVTNLGFVRNDPAACEASLCTLLSRNLSAVAIRNIYDVDITKRVHEASRRSGTPLFIYTGEYYEQVIFQSMKLIERDQADSDRASLVDSLLRRRSADEVRTLIYDAFHATGATIQCAEVKPLSHDDASLYAHIDELEHVTESIRASWSRIETAQVFRYHDRALLVVTFDRPPDAFFLETDSEFIQLLRPFPNMLCGISEEIPLSQGDIALRQAAAAFTFAQAEQEHIVRWASLNACAFEAAARADRMITSTCELYQRVIEKHDEKHNGNLAGTARALAETGGDVREAADALFQHPNTVRNHMRKLKSIFGMHDATDRELIRFLMLVHLA